jgi:hypothetical protein
VILVAGWEEVVAEVENMVDEAPEVPTQQIIRELARAPGRLTYASSRLSYSFRQPTLWVYAPLRFHKMKIRNYPFCKANPLMPLGIACLIKGTRSITTQLLFQQQFLHSP